jgi:hypothetical protein
MAESLGKASLGAEKKRELKEGLSSEVEEGVVVDQLLEKTDAKLKKNEDRLAKLPDSFRDTVHDNIVKYFLTSTGRFDKDQDNDLDKTEFESYSSAMLTRLEGIIDQYAPTEEMLKAREEQREALEKAKGSLEKAGREKIKDLVFDESALNSAGGIHGEIGKMNGRSKRLHKIGGVVNTAVADFKAALKKFEKSKEAWGVFLRGSPFVDDPDTVALRNTRTNLINLSDQKIDHVKDEKKKIEEYGEKVNGAADGLRREQFAKKAEINSRLDEARARESANGSGVLKNREAYDKLTAQKQDLETKREDMYEYHTSLIEYSEQVKEKRQGNTENIFATEDMLGKFSDRIDESVKTIDEALKNQTLPDEQREYLEARRDTLLEKKGSADEHLGNMMEKSEVIDQTLIEATDELDFDMENARDSEVKLSDFIANDVEVSIMNLEGTINTLEIARLSNGSAVEQLEAKGMLIDQNLLTIDRIDENAAETVLANNIGNQKLLDGLESQRDFLKATDIDNPNLWDATGGIFLNKAGEGLSLISEELLDPLSDWMISSTEDIPVLGGIAELTSNVPIGLVSGVIDGAGELTKGVAFMVGNPMKTWDGVKELWGPNAGTAWTEMGKALVAYEDFEDGRIGKGIGKIGFNLILTATGASAAGSGAKVCSLTYQSARTAGRGVIYSSSKAGLAFTTTFGTEFANGISKIPGNIGRGAGSLARSPSKIATKLKQGSLANISDDIARVSDDLASAGQKLDETAVGGNKVSDIPELKGKSFDDLQALKGDDLMKLGIKTPRQLREFLKYKEAVKKMEGLHKTLAGLEHTKEIVEIAPELQTLFGVLGKRLSGKRLDKFIGEFNKKYPDGFPGKKMKIIRESKAGLVAFNAEGKLQKFASRIDYQGYRTKITLQDYVLAKLEKKYPDGANKKSLQIEYQADLAKYNDAVDYLSSIETQGKINAIFDNLDDVPEEALQGLRDYIHKNALEQHFDNPEQYVSHGFDHSLNVKAHMESFLDSDPKIAEYMKNKYGINVDESRMMLKLVAVFHDFGYPDIGDLGKALHGVSGAEIASTGEFLSVMRKVITSKGANFDDLMFDFKNSILYHSADKVEIFRDAKIYIGKGEFIIDADNVVQVITHRAGKLESPITIHATPENAGRIKKLLETYNRNHPESAIDMSKVVIKDAKKGDLVQAGENAGKFKGRTVDLLAKGDEMLGIQYKVTNLADDPMNFMIRLTDNCDMTAERFSALQKTEAFREIYTTFGPLKGNLKGAVMERLEEVEKVMKKAAKLRSESRSLRKAGKIAEADSKFAQSNLVIAEGSDLFGELIAVPEYKTILDKYSSNRTPTRIREILEEYKSGVIDEILAKPEHKGAVEKHGERLREFGMKQSSESVRHFGGAENVKNIKLCCGGQHLKITVDQAGFDELNKTRVQEKVLDSKGNVSYVSVGVGEYQIWRAYEAYRSLQNGGRNIAIIVVNENGDELIANFGEYFGKINPIK